MPVELIIYEISLVVILILTVFGLMDRIFFIFGLLFNWLVSLSFLVDGSLITDKVYNANLSAWILYTVPFLSSNNIPSNPMLILIMFIVIDALLFAYLSR